MLTKEQIKNVEKLVKTFDLTTNSKIINLSFVDLEKLDQTDMKQNFKEFIQQNKAAGLHYALVSDEDNVMSDDEIAVYPLDSNNLDVLTNTEVFGVDGNVALKAMNLIEKLNELGTKNLNIDTIFVASGEFPDELQ